MKDLLLPSTAPPGPPENILLREALEILIRELSLLSERNPEDLPKLKKKKVVVASRLGNVPRRPVLPNADGFDLVELKTLIRELEVHSRREIKGHLDLIGRQLLALQEEHQFWLECLNVSFAKFCDPVP